MDKVKNAHEKIVSGIQQMLVDTRINLPYYGEFNLFINFQEREDLPTCAVNVTLKGMNFYYNTKFLDKLSQKEVNFIILHEDFHLLFNHPTRTVTGKYNHRLSNIAQDMIINHIIWEEISHDFVDIPRYSDGKMAGKVMALFVPKEYTGKLIFEELYEWLKEKKEEHDKKQKEKRDQQKNQKDGDSEKGQADKDQDGDGDDGEDDWDGYGENAKDPKNENGTIENPSLDQIFGSMDDNDGSYLDVHIGDDVPEEVKEAMVKEAMDRLAARGLSSGNIEKTLNKLRKQKKDYLREIKRAVSNTIFGSIKDKTIVRPNRRGISGVKGNKKTSSKINCILDTSGSMNGTFDHVLSYIYRNDIDVNLIQCDTSVKAVGRLKSIKDVEKIVIKGLGGTVIQPAVDHVVDNFNSYNTLILTDGETDRLDLSRVKGKVLIISVSRECPILATNGKVKQMVIEPTK